MNSRNLVDPELAVMLDPIMSTEWNSGTLQMMREFMDDVGKLREPCNPGVQVSRMNIPSFDGLHSIALDIYRSETACERSAAYIYIHGGGLVGGNPALGRTQCSQLARDLGCLVVAPAYRVAPETRFPGAIEDCFSTLSWLYQNAGMLGVDADRIAVGGDSAGGGLAAALTIVNRERRKIPIVLQVLNYPMLDDRTGSTVAASPFAGEFLWTEASNRFGWQSYLGPELFGQCVPSFAAPAREEDVRGLPPIYLAVGQLDLFVDECLIYARRFINAGILTELHVFPGGLHSFDSVPTAEASVALTKSRTAALARAFATAKC